MPMLFTTQVDFKCIVLALTLNEGEEKQKIVQNLNWLEAMMLALLEKAQCQDKVKTAGGELPTTVVIEEINEKEICGNGPIKSPVAAREEGQRIQGEKESAGLNLDFLSGLNNEEGVFSGPITEKATEENEELDSDGLQSVWGEDEIVPVDEDAAWGADANNMGFASLPAGAQEKADHPPGFPEPKYLQTVKERKPKKKKMGQAH